MDYTILKKQIESISDRSNIYLVEKLSDNSGFFCSSGKLLYIALDIFNYSAEGIETEYLKLQTHIRISSIKNNQSFKDDFYNIIEFKNELDDANAESFLHLCSIHAANEKELNFKDFFYSLITLFQLTPEQAYKNALGLYGELKFMQYINKQNHIDLSLYWHKNGTYSKYDFSNGKIGLEVKTTSSSDSEVTIKHSQIFGEHECYLVAVICEEFETGETIQELIDELFQSPTAFNNLNFSLNLTKELNKISHKDRYQTRFITGEIMFYSPEIINPFPEIPDTVTSLSYRLDLSEYPSFSDEKINSIISSL